MDGEQRQQRLEVEPKDADATQQHQRPQHAWRSDDVAKALRDTAEHRQALRGPRRSVEVGWVDHRQPHQDRDVAHRVDPEVHRRAPERQRDAGDRRSDDTGRVERRRVQCDRVEQVAARDHLGGEGLADGHVHRVDAAEHEGQDEDVPDLDDAGDGDRKQDERLKRGSDLCPDDHHALVHAVGQDATERSQDGRRGEFERQHDPELQRRAAEQQDEPRLADRLHPGTHQAEHLTDPEEPVIAVAHRRERAAGAAGPGGEGNRSVVGRRGRSGQQL